jgi:hypothetical protein
VNVREWLRRATPGQRRETEELVEEIRILRMRVERARDHAAPALRPALKGAAGHLHWAERSIRDWLARNP